MLRGSARRTWFGLLAVVALSAIFTGGCGETEDPAASPPPDTGDAGDTEEVDSAGEFLDANLPRADIGIGVTTIPDAQADASDADAYTLPPNSITTCGGFFECMQECPPEVDSCVGICHEAMDEETEYLVQRLMSCLNSYGCRDGDCAMRNCGSEASACYNDD